MNIFDFEPNAASAGQIEQIRAIQEKFQLLAFDILFEIPNSAHRTSALRHLLDAKMTLVHAITHPQTLQLQKAYEPAQDTQ